jgi:hypothetical protein
VNKYIFKKILGDEKMFVAKDYRGNPVVPVSTDTIIARMHS